MTWLVSITWMGILVCGPTTPGVRAQTGATEECMSTSTPGTMPWVRTEYVTR